MSSQPDSIINLARSFIGVKESPPDSNNVLFNTAYYGRQVSGPSYPWCCAFVWFVFRQAGLQNLFFGGNKTASCTTLMNFAKQNGLFISSAFKRGDLALFNWNASTSTAQHIGIITDYSDGFISTIEGNTALGNDSDGGSVMERKRPLSVVIGAYRPAYKEDSVLDSVSLINSLSDISGTGDEHSPWASDAISHLTDLGIFKGDGDGNFGWSKFVTREMLAQIIFSLLNSLNFEELT